MNAKDMKSVKPGDTLVYDDGRPGHRGVKAVVVSNGTGSLIVQFEDRAETTTIKHNDSGWTDYLKLHAPTEPAYERGDYVKVEFPDETTGVGEWMWVRVQRCDAAQQLVFGTLDNTPVDDSTGKLKLGTELAIAFAQIREHKKSSEFASGAPPN